MKESDTMAYCEYKNEPKHGMCGLSEKYCGECLRCDEIDGGYCADWRNMAREEEGGGEMTDTEVIEYLMDSQLPDIVRHKSVNAIRGKNAVVVRLEGFLKENEGEEIAEFIESCIDIALNGGKE